MIITTIYYSVCSFATTLLSQLITCILCYTLNIFRLVGISIPIRTIYKDDIELLRNWIDGLKSQKYDDVFLFLVSDETSVDKKLENLIPKDNKQVFWEMFENRKEEWLTSFFAKNGYKIHEDAVAAILEMIENNTEALRNECSRFFLCFEKIWDKIML